MNLYQKKGEYDEMEYIAREALLEQLKAMESYNTSPMYRRGYDDCVEAILKASAADVVPVVHGKWIRPHWKNSNYCCDCSECGGEAMHREYQWNKQGIYPICPNCGAKMGGERGS